MPLRTPVSFTAGRRVLLGDRVYQPGDPVTALTSTSAVQSVTITGVPTGGTFTLTYAGQTTAALAYNITAAALQAALVALSTIGPSNVVVSGTAPYNLAFAGVLGSIAVANLTSNSAGLLGGTTPGVAVATLTAGGTAISSIWSLKHLSALVNRRILVPDAPVRVGTNRGKKSTPSDITPGMHRDRA